jgi:ABC-type Zn2+ transport system substrate-binding protein/surface adhesin
VGFAIARSQDDEEKMRKYAIVIRKFERRLNIAINDFPEIGIYGFEEDFENKEEDDDSKLGDPWSSERIGETREEENEDKDEDEDKEDEDDDPYHLSLYRR